VVGADVALVAVDRSRLVGLRERRGAHFVATLLMGPTAAVAIVFLRQVGLVARSPLWVIPTILVGGQSLNLVFGAWWDRSGSVLLMHLRVGSSAVVATATMYATGWGPALAVGSVLVSQEGLAIVGPEAEWAVLGWNLSCLAVGQVLIAVGVVPSLIPAPAVHGLAVLAGLGTIFSCRSLRTALNEKAEAAASTLRSERRFRALVQSSQDLVFVFDTTGTVTYASPSSARVLGFLPERMLGPDKAILVHPDDLDALRNAMRQAAATAGGHAELLFRVQRFDGTWCWVEGDATNLVDDSAVGGTVVNIRDVTDRRAAESFIRHQALHDPLTGLPNRTLFADRLEHALARQSRHGGYVAVLVVDLDGFKTVNDSLGHAAGDALLVAVAQRFETALRDFDTIARLGGDEFVMVVDSLEVPDQAGRIARRVLDVLARPFAVADRDVVVGASIGVVVADGSRTDVADDSLLRNADTAMYRAKRECKGCYRVFEASMHAAAVQRLELEQALRAALADGTFHVVYQPILATHTGQVTGFEALLRWDHPRDGAIPPDLFIPIAEETNLIVELGRTVLQQACTQATTWRTQHPQLNLTVAVNVSPKQFVYSKFVADVEHALAAANLPPTALTLEITESMVANDSGHIINTLDRLRARGVRIAIDDFGTGYSSFATLAELPIDIIKIDKRFIDSVARTHQGRGFVNAIIQLAHTLNLETIAEGVEHPEQHQALRDLGSTHVQGYLHSRPLPPSDTTHYLHTKNAEPDNTTRPPVETRSTG
jgi:diguanylate cyclase (GGDEF)-like protein/PAS domain S-box-containing protein